MEMNIDTRRKIAAILRLLSEAQSPMGSRTIARELTDRGIELKERMVRYYLDEMDQLGFTENLGRPGRRLTDRGRQEIDSAVAVDRIGFVSARVDELAYKITFDMARRLGSVVVNISSVPAAKFPQAKKIIAGVIDAGLGMGRYLAIGKGGNSLAGSPIPRNRVAIGTVCSVTLNGVFCSQGIPVVSRFGGLLEMQDGKPRRFTQIIRYDGTTVDPIEIFIKGKMTRVDQVVKTGAGTIGASFREIPASALSQAEEVIEKLDALGLGGVLTLGVPGKPLLDIPVSQERVGLVVAPGLNPIAAVEEAGISTENMAMAALCEFEGLLPVSEI